MHPAPIPGSGQLGTWLAALALIGLWGCQPLFGLERREPRAAASSGGAGGQPGDELRYCAATTVEGADYTCLDGSRDADPARAIEVLGRFEWHDELLAFERCRLAVQDDECQDELSSLTAEGYFGFVARQDEHARVTFSRNEVEGVAALWIAPSAVTRIDVGAARLLLPDGIAGLGRSGGFSVDEGLGMVLVTVKDCSRRLAAGLRVTARTTSLDGERATGDAFAIHVLPKDAPTDATGRAGLVNVAPGFVTVRAHQADGCVVAEIDLVVEPGRVVYASLLPTQATGADPGRDGNSGAAGAPASDPTDGGRG